MGIWVNTYENSFDFIVIDLLVEDLLSVFNLMKDSLNPNYPALPFT